MSEPQTPRCFVFPASLPLTGVVVRGYGNGRVKVTLEVPESDQDTAACVGALTACHFQVTVALAGLPDAPTLEFGARLPRTGTVDRGRGDGSTWLTLEADQADQAAARAIRKLTGCALQVQVLVDHEKDDADDARPGPRPARPSLRQQAIRRNRGSGPGLQ